jgi:MFS family permease
MAADAPLLQHEAPADLAAWLAWLPGLLLVLWHLAFQLGFGYLAPAISRDPGLADNQLATIAAAYLVPYALMQWPAGWLTDRYGARRLLAPAAFVCGGGALLFAAAPNYGVLLLSRILVGTAAARAFPACAQMARQALPAAEFPLAMGLTESTVGFGSALVGATLLEAPGLGWRPLVRSEAGAVLLLAMLLLPACLSAWRQRPADGEADPEGGPGSGVGDGDGDGERTVAQAWLPVGLCCLLYAWSGGVVFGLGDFWGLWLERGRGFPEGLVDDLGVEFFLALGGALVVFGFLGRSTRWRRLLMVAGTALFLPLLVLLIPPPGLPALAMGATERGSSILLMLMGIAAATGALAFGEAGSQVGVKAVARVSALVNAAGCLSGALFAALPTWLGVEQRGAELLLVLYGGLGLLGLAAALLLAWPRGSGKSPA